MMTSAWDKGVLENASDYRYRADNVNACTGAQSLSLLSISVYVPLFASDSEYQLSLLTAATLTYH